MKKFTQKNIKPSFILFLFLISVKSIFSQVTIISNSTINDCDFTFYDTGGVNASGYSANQDFTTTICPDVAGNAITLTWYTFTLGSGDYMDIFDGNSTSAPSLGHYTGNSLNNLSAYASVFNTTGCLTVVFHSDANNNGVFNAAVACEIPCAHPVAGIATPNVPTIKLCKGQTVNFDGALSSAATGFNLTNYNWDFGDQNSQTGTNVIATHSYTQTGRFIASLEVTDNNGCKNKNAAFVEVLVETLPKYTITTPTAVCLDEAFCIDASVVSPPLPAPTTNVFGSPIHVPDNVGQCFESTQFFNVFPVGAHLTNTNQLLSIYTNMSHTFVGDLIISIISPSGQSVILHQQGGGGANLGGDYYWTPNTTNPTWAATGGGAIPSGTYSSVESLSGLIGSELNGTWTFKVCDMWAQDEGDVWAFGVNFDPSFYVDLQSLSPTIGMGADSSYISGPNMTSISTNGDHFCTKITNPANNTYTYTIKNSFGCTHDTTFSININPSPTASFTNNTVCQGVATNFTDASVVTSGNISSWNWDFTNDGISDATTQQATYTYSSSNTYTASLTVSTANGCTSTATNVVNIYGHAIPNFTANNVCFGATTTFVDNTTTTTNANTGSINSWTWDFNDASNATIQSPTHTYSNIANNTTNSTYQVTLTVTTNNGCVDNITKPVIVYSNPTATFTSDEVCFNSPSHLLDASNGNGNPLTNYAWDFTNDNLADINGPNTINYTLPLVGNNIVNYTVTSAPVAGLTCKTSTSQIVITNPLPQADFTYTNNCLNTQPNLFDGSLSSVTLGSIDTYAWNYGDTQTDSSPLATSNHAYNLPIQYNVTLTVTTNKGCENSVIKQVEVYPLPIASILSKPNVCFGSPTTFTANALPNSGNVVLWAWDVNNTPNTIESNGQNNSYVFTSEGWQVLNVIATTDHGCIDMITRNVYVNYIPKPEFTVDKSKGCPIPEHCVVFTDNTAALVNPAKVINWAWNFGNGASANSVTGSNQSTCYTNSSSNQLALYTVTLTTKTDSNCVASITKTDFITVYPKPIASYTTVPEFGNVVVPVVHFINESIDYTNVNWSFGDGKSDLTTINPNHEYATLASNDYYSSLVVTNQYGCSDTAKAPVNIAPDFVFYIPNSFTPNGDGINDGFTGMGIGIEKFELWIYNRWGTSIYYTDEISKPWNGLIQGSSNEAKEDVYNWKVELKDVLGKKHNYVGHVTLLR